MIRYLKRRFIALIVVAVTLFTVIFLQAQFKPSLQGYVEKSLKCHKRLSMVKGTITDRQISRLHFKTTVSKARAWVAAATDAEQWLRVDLGTEYTIARVTRVRTQGRRGVYSQWVTKYKLQYSNDEGETFQYYRDQGETTDKEFAGNTDADTVVSHDLNPPIITRYIRFRPITWHGWIAMRVELYGCSEEIPCPCLGLQKTSDVDEAWPSAIKCKLHRPDKVGCAHAYRYYGYPGHVEPERKCDETHYPDICSFQVTESDDHELICDATVCGSSDPKIGSINPDMGKITNWKPSPKKAITATVEEAVKTNRKNGFGFLFIKCGDILQALTFPPKLKKVQDGSNRSSININIITLDSISRPHFYRILPRASGALRKIIQDTNIKSTAMDFELFQSVGQHTFDNLRPFFSGVMKDDNTIGDTAKTVKAPLGVEVLFGTFKEWDYQTLYQEDLCWYDRWGIGLTDLEIRRIPDGQTEFRERWSEFQRKVRAKHIDDFGLSHFSGTVLDKYHETNHYEYPPQVCLNGQFFSQYFMDYIKMMYNAITHDHRAKPLLSFMHFNTGHEYTGKRIVNMDANLAKFLINMAAFPDTLTMMFSDHGNKNTQYSYNSEEGRREVFDPVFFMIVPDGVAERLGRQRMSALATNQKRLFTLLDVHRALMSLNDPVKMKSQNSLVAGIFAVLPANRTCVDLTLMPLTRCKCEGFDSYNPAKDNSDSHKWLAEFALGTLNDAIQKQYMGGNENSTQKYGYGNCQRLIGKSFTNVVQRSQGEYIMTTMNLHVIPPTGYNEDEVFQVSLKQYAQAKDKVWLTSYVRQSKYSKFKSCADNSVDIKLCACAKEETASATKSGEATANGVPRKMFGSETTVKDLHSHCLLFLRRNYAKVALALEVTNVCSDRTYKFELFGSSGERVYSNTLPIKLELAPNTFYFLTSVIRYTTKESFPLYFEASVEVKEEHSQEFTNLGKVDVS